MIQIFLDWLQVPANFIISDDIKFLFACVASLFVLSFLFDFFRFIMYYITRKD